MAVLIILLFAFLIFMAVCAFRESSVTSPYKANGVYGRFTAYIALDLTLVGIIGIIAPWVTLALDVSDIGLTLILFAVGAVCFSIGILIYRSAYKRCPESLKKKCITSMIITGCGVAMKLGVFFISSVWKLQAYAGASEANGFAERYVTRDGDYYTLQSTFNQSAILREDRTGNTVEVHVHGSDGNLIDSSGKLYYPD